MAGALAQLHAADILHRDVKPSNIGYTRDGVPKLMDFGIARVRLELAEEEEEATLDLDLEDDDALPPRWSAIAEDFPARFRFAGTLSYLSPEAMRGEPADASFDLWGLAIVLYECLLGRKVFAGNPQQVMSRIRAGVVPDFSQVCPEHDEHPRGVLPLGPPPFRRPPAAERRGDAASGWRRCGRRWGRPPPFRPRTARPSRRSSA